MLDVNYMLQKAMNTGALTIYGHFDGDIRSLNPVFM